MIDLNQKVEVTITSSNINHYKDKGYNIDSLVTKNKHGHYTIPIGTTLNIKIRDLSEQSHQKVKVKCDYCNKIIEKQYRDYINQTKRSLIEKDACKDCSSIKNAETNLIKYGKTHKNQYTYEEVYNIFKEMNCLLITKVYEGTNQYLDFICLKHQDKGIQKRRFNKVIQSDYSCKYCGIEARAKTHIKYNIDTIKQEFKDRGYIVGNCDKYENQVQKIPYICTLHPELGIQYLSYKTFRIGHDCYSCGLAKNSGDNNARWKGGITDTTKFLRSIIVDWKKDSMRASNYKCVITGDKFDVIHHTQSFSNIMKEIIEITNIIIKQEVNQYTIEELDLLEKTCLDLHKKYGNGKCLSHKIHYLYHNIYGDNNTPSQFQEFTTRYHNGEFTEQLNQLEQQQLNQQQ